MNLSWKALSDTFEAIIGSVLLDGGICSTCQVVHTIMQPFLYNHMDISKLKHAPATNLQIYVQENKLEMNIDCILLPDNQYECTITINNHVCATEKDIKKKEAINKAYISANRELNIANK